MTTAEIHAEMSLALKVLHPCNLELFATREDLLDAYALRMHLRNGIDLRFAKIAARDAYTYQPHLYRGGYVIPGYGYSVERIGVNVTVENSGHPELVKRTR